MEAKVEELYKWIDGYSITRQKKNITRDFSDAGIIIFFKIVQLT